MFGSHYLFFFSLFLYIGKVWKLLLTIKVQKFMKVLGSSNPGFIVNTKYWKNSSKIARVGNNGNTNLNWLTLSAPVNLQISL